jgi:hypothetical protein
MLEHAHRPREFDSGHGQDGARQTNLLDHCRHVQRQERAFKDT